MLMLVLSLTYRIVLETIMFLGKNLIRSNNKICVVIIHSYLCLSCGVHWNGLLHREIDSSRGVPIAVWRLVWYVIIRVLSANSYHWVFPFGSCFRKVNMFCGNLLKIIILKIVKKIQQLRTVYKFQLLINVQLLGLSIYMSNRYLCKN